MVDELIMHIGTHKTGTTAIQGALSASREILLTDRLLYPSTGRGAYGQRRTPYTGHANLAREAGGWDMFDPDAGGSDDVVAEAKDHDIDSVLVSAEDFSVPEGVERKIRWVRTLGERLGVTRVRVVVYLRPQWEYMESSYAELVRSGYSQRLFPGQVDLDIDHPRFEYPGLLEPWSDAFGQVDVYGYSGYSPSSVVDHFATEVLDLPIAAPSLSKRPNRRAGEKTIEMLRCLRGLLAVARADSKLPEVFFGVRQLLREEIP
ncbi:MAG: hypothetical protein GEU79_15020, partial [Acidimicrobiia bacterium]|nr:hypothetical protein [Acidimicrobiia bacterium]